MLPQIKRQSFSPLWLLTLALDLADASSDDAASQNYHGEHPIFLYGQNYMGIVEAHLGSVLFRLIGTSVFSLKLGMIILYALFLVCMYLLTRLLYTENFALIIVALLGLGNRLLLTSE